ncbi:MAG: trypsin-like peptidase domain-containing protein, partial [Chloroflexi bacterium]|nr:trypsin-like peptidase domain-containing protein [Chloroflexota bacterium]
MIQWEQLRGPTSQSRFGRLYFVLPCLVILLLLGGATSKPAAAALDRDKIARALNATVLILVPDNSGDLVAGGSGTILDADKGYILTNFHVVGDTDKGTLTNDQGLAVLGVMPANMRGAPVLKYRAKVVNGDPKLDLAVLQIVALVDSPRAPLPENLGLTAIERGDSDQLLIGDPLYVIGYPGLGGATVTMTSGLVSGFLDEKENGAGAWIKTDAEVNHGNSGGLAVNADGQFIGVPSAGVADVQAAGKISLVRTGNLALKFYDSVLMGTVPSNINSGNNQQTTSSSAQIVKVQFGESINRRNEVSKPAVKFKSGITDLYAAFEYSGFGDGQTFTYVWYYNGGEDSRDSLPWDAGNDGKNWVSLGNEDGLADGFYEVELLLDGQSLFRGGVVIGAQATAACKFGPLTFASSISKDDQPIDPGQEFANVETVYGFFDATGMSNGTPWKTVWYLDGRQVNEWEAVWEFGENSAQWVSLKHPDNLPVGAYKLELYCNDKLAQSGEFTIAEQATAQSDEVSITGRVYDRDNKRKAIKGALIVLLNPGVAVKDWVDADFPKADIYATGSSNSRGEFQLSAKVTPGESYGIVVAQDAYQPITQDDYQIPADASDPYTLDVPM